MGNGSVNSHVKTSPQVHGIVNDRTWEGWGGGGGLACFSCMSRTG